MSRTQGSSNTAVNLISMLTGRVLPWVVVCVALWLFHQSAVALAQENPQWNPYLQVLASANRARSFAFLVGILGILYGLGQRELRRRASAEFSRRLAELKNEV